MLSKDLDTPAPPVLLAVPPEQSPPWWERALVRLGLLRPAAEGFGITT